MKPTPAMFKRLQAPAERTEDQAAAKSSRAGPTKGEPLPAEPSPGFNEPLERRRRRELLDTLSRTNKEQERVRIEEDLKKLEARLPARPQGQMNDVGRALEGAVLEARTPATPGIVAVRVIGAGASEEKVPLEGLRVRATQGDRSAEGLTDGTGQALIFLGGAGSFEVEVLSAEEKVLEQAKGLLTPGKSVSVEVSVSERAELSELFARGRAYLEAVRRRAERISSLQSQDVQAFEQRIATLESTVARLEQALAQLTQGNTKAPKATQDTKGGTP